MASKMGYMRFLKKKMADGGFPVMTVQGQGKGGGDIATTAGLDYDKTKPKPKPTQNYANGGKASPNDSWGEIGGDPGYGQPYHRHNSSGEPHTNGYFEDEHPIEYMAEGGMAYSNQPGEPHPDLDHHEQDPNSGSNPSYSNQMGEPYPDVDHMEQEDPDLMPHSMATDQIHPGMYAEGGMAYHHQGHEGEMEDDQEHPEMDHEDAMDHEMANFASGGVPKLGSGKRFEHLTHQLAGKGAHDPKALAAYIGRKALGKAHFQKLAAKGRAKSSRMGEGGMAGKSAFAHALMKKK
jgi:hypothetical protein